MPVTTSFLAQIHINPRSRQAHRDLADAHRMHQRVMSLFPDGVDATPRSAAAVLYRVEVNSRGTALLVQSNIEACFDKLPEDYGSAATRDISPLLAALEKDMAVRYRIDINPMITGPANGAKRGPRILLNGQAATTWWTARAESHGLLLLGYQHRTDRDPAHGVRPDGITIRHNIIRFDGAALITDAEKLRESIRTGIGKGRPYGCGLLSIAPAPR